MCLAAERDLCTRPTDAPSLTLCVVWHVVLQRKGVEGYILDLRDNPGGLVKGSIDVARLLLDGHPTVFSVVGRDGEPLQEVSTVCGPIKTGAYMFMPYWMA